MCENEQTYNMIKHKKIAQIVQQKYKTFKLQKASNKTILNKKTKKMGVSNQQQILVPCKFISIMLHLIVTTMNYFSYHDNIIVAYPDMISKDSIYQGAATSFLASNTLIIIFLAFQILLLFLGVNLFREKLSVFVSTLHILGAILGSVFTYSYWAFDLNWILWFLFSIIPVTCEVFAICTTPRKTI